MSPCRSWKMWLFLIRASARPLLQSCFQVLALWFQKMTKNGILLRKWLFKWWGLEKCISSEAWEARCICFNQEAAKKSFCLSLQAYTWSVSLSLWCKRKDTGNLRICWKLKLVKWKFISKCIHITIKENNLCSNYLVWTVNSVVIKAFSARQDNIWKAMVVHKQKLWVSCIDSWLSFFGLHCAEGWDCVTSPLEVALLKIFFYSQKQAHWTIYAILSIQNSF